MKNDFLKTKEDIERVKKEKEDIGKEISPIIEIEGIRRKPSVKI